MPKGKRPHRPSPRHQAPDEAILLSEPRVTPMAKPVRYPRKLREKLEKVAQTRNERAGNPKRVKHPSEMTPDELLDELGNTMWRDFLMPGTVALMGVKIDEGRKRVDIIHHLTLATPINRIGVPTPWLNSEPVTFRSS